MKGYNRTPERINRFSHPVLFPLLLYPIVSFCPLLLGWTLFVFLPGWRGPEVGVAQVLLACYPTYWVFWVHWHDMQGVTELPIPRQLFTRAGFRMAAGNLSSDPRRSLLASALFLFSLSVVPYYTVGFVVTSFIVGRLVFAFTGSVSAALLVGVVVGLLVADMFRRLIVLAKEECHPQNSRRLAEVGTQADAKRRLKEQQRRT
jgi:hypothetical protein